jgi:hypothetical protein
LVLDPPLSGGAVIQEAEMPATEREILEDRWDCFIYEREIGDEWSKPMVKLDKLISAFYEAVMREPWTGYDYARVDRPGLDGSGGVHGDVHAAFKAALLDGIEKAEAARAEFPKPLEVAS